jgi:DNA-binding MarR family transcriptional regulator
MQHQADELDRLWRSVSHAMFDIIKQTVQEQALPAQFVGMMHQVLSRDGVTVSELARRTGLAKSHISKTIDRLTEMGLVEKRPDPQDRRLVRIYPTDLSRSLFREVHQRVMTQWTNVIASMPPDKVDALVAGLRALETALAAAAPRSPTPAHPEVASR